MKTISKSVVILVFLLFSAFGIQAQNQQTEVNNKNFNPDRPFFFSPKNHDPNFLKSGKISEKSFYQRKSEWQHFIDSTWGPGAPLAKKLQIFNSYAKKIHDESDVLCFLNMNWDSLYNHYLNQITESTSKGAFSSIMSHFSYDLKDVHTIALDSTVVLSSLNPGVPVLWMGSYLGIEHFGAVTTVLPDSTNLILRVVPNHPLNLEPGDIILGYEGIPWKNLVRELLDGGLPMHALTGGSRTTDTYENLCGAGLNWHLFSTIDILKYSTGDTLHLSVLPMLNLDTPLMVNNEQMAIKNIPFPHILPFPFESDTVVTYGILENTNIGYIFLSSHMPTTKADEQFYNAINALKNTDALIIDMRLNFGGWAMFEKAFNLMFNEYHKTLEHAYRCNTNTFNLCPGGNSALFQINGKDPDYYDRPIAVLLGPTCVSNGDLTAQRLRYHPMVRFFGASSAAAHGWRMSVENIPDWILFYSGGDMFHVSEPGIYLNRKEFPIDFPVWFNKDDVAKGIDPIVEKSLEWINNLAYGHDVTINNGLFSPVDETVTINAIIENPNSHELSARLIFESLDGSFVDSTDMDIPNLTEVSQWQGKWKIAGPGENIYWVSVKVKDLTDGSYFTNKHVTRVTTAPLLIDSLVIKKISSTKYMVQPYFKNAGKTMEINKLTVKLSSTDKWFKYVIPGTTLCPNLLPGQVKKSAGFEIAYDAATFPGYFNLTFTISSDGWPFWAFNTDSLSTGIEKLALPEALFLEQNYPNPFNSTTTINWQIDKNSKVTLKVLDIVGRTVATLVDDQRPQGKYETKFNAATLPKGIYFYQLKAGEFSQTRKMILLE